MGLFNGSKKNSLIKEGYKLYNQGNYQESLECYDKILEIDPLYIKGWHGRGAVLQKLEQYKESLKAFGYVLGDRSKLF